MLLANCIAISLSFLLSVMLILDIPRVAFLVCLLPLGILGFGKLDKLLRVWFLSTAFLSTTTFLSLWGRPLLDFDRLIIILIFILVLIFYFVKKIKLYFLWVDLIYFFYLFVVFLSSSETGGGFHYFGKIADLNIIPYLIFFVTRNIVRSNDVFEQFLNNSILLCIIISSIGIIEHFSKIDFFPTYLGIVERAGWARINGPFTQDASFGVIISFLILVSFYELEMPRKLSLPKVNPLGQKKIILFGILGGMVALFFNFYRGIWIAFILGWCIWNWINKGTIKMLLLVFFMLFILVNSIGIIQKTDIFKRRVVNFETIESRFKKYEVALYEFKKSPWRGVGFGRLYQYDQVKTGAHNSFLTVLSEEGILGFSTLMLFWILLMKQALHSLFTHKNKFSGIFICLSVVYFVSSMGLNIMQLKEVNNIFFCITGLCIAKMEMNNERLRL